MDKIKMLVLLFCYYFAISRDVKIFTSGMDILGKSAIFLQHPRRKMVQSEIFCTWKLP